MIVAYFLLALGDLAMNTFQIKVFSKKIKEITLARYLIQLTKHRNFTCLSTLSQVDGAH